MNIENEISHHLFINLDLAREGFEILSRSTDLKTLIKNFAGILKSNLLIKEVIIYESNSITGVQNLLYPEKAEKGIANNGNLTNNKINFNLNFRDGTGFQIILTDKLDGTSFTEYDKVVSRLFIQLLDYSYQSYTRKLNEKKLIFSLNHKALQLNNLIETGIDISNLKKTEHLIERVLERAASITNSSKAFATIHSGDSINYFFFPGEFNPSDNIKNQIKASFNFRGEEYSFFLINKESRNGEDIFEDTDRLILSAISRQFNAALENEYLLKESLEKQKIEQDIAVAASIQKMIIPKTLPAIKGYELCGVNIPSKEIGGDYYDCVKLNNGKYAMIIADVAGKGIQAALLVSTLQASLHAYLESGTDLEMLYKKLNKFIFSSSTPDKYITAVILLFDSVSGEIELLNAGHNPVLYYNKEIGLIKLDACGLALGMMDLEIPVQQKKLKMNPGDRILLYTDGITEAFNEDEDLYDDMNLEKYFLENEILTAGEFLRSLIIDVKKFTGTTPQSDDITALYLKRL